MVQAFAGVFNIFMVKDIISLLEKQDGGNVSYYIFLY